MRSRLAIFMASFILAGCLGTGFAQDMPQKPAPVPLPEKNPEHSPESPNDPNTPPATGANPDAAQSSPSATTFTGIISKSKDQFLLKELSTGKKYQLDDQAKAKPFEGKKVTISGVLNASNVIQIETIDLAK